MITGLPEVPPDDRRREAIAAAAGPATAATAAPRAGGPEITPAGQSTDVREGGHSCLLKRREAIAAAKATAGERWFDELHLGGVAAVKARRQQLMDDYFARSEIRRGKP